MGNLGNLESQVAAGSETRPAGQDHSAFVTEQALRAAHLPPGLRDPARLVPIATALLADNLSERGAADFAAWLGGELGRVAATRSEKIEHPSEEMIQLLAKEAGVAPSVADNLLGAYYEALWHVLTPGQVDALVAQVPYSLARELRAAMPGQKRGAF